MVALTACDFKEGDHYLDGRQGGNPGKVSLHPVASAELAWLYNEHCNDDADCFRNYITEKFLETGNVDDRGRLILETIVAADQHYLDNLDGWSVNTGDCIAVQTTEAGEFVTPQVYRHAPGLHHHGPDCYPGGESTIPGWTYD